MKQHEVQERQQPQQHPSKIPCPATHENMLFQTIDIEFYEPSRSRDELSRLEDPVMCKMVSSIITVSAPTGTTKKTAVASKSLAIAVIYNLAITNHLWGLETGSTKLLQKALRLYEIVYRVHQENGDVALEPTAISTIASTLNNVASIYAFVKNHELATRALRGLLPILISCSTPGEQLFSKYGQTWKICWRNIMTLIVGPPAAGAA